MVTFKSRGDSQEPVNLAGVGFYDVEEIDVAEWHPLPNGEGQPTQVHVYLRLKGLPHQLVMRFKGPKSLDNFIVALITHRRGVFGGPPKALDG